LLSYYPAPEPLPSGERPQLNQQQTCADFSPHQLGRSIKSEDLSIVFVWDRLERPICGNKWFIALTGKNDGQTAGRRRRI
jgi:hypothetical protein